MDHDTDASPLPPWLYHGTTELYLGQMLDKGILPCTATGAVMMTCLADELAIAQHHAFHMSECDRTPEVIFRIPIDRFDPSLFVLEDNFVRLAPSSGRGLAKFRKLGSLPWKAMPWTWQGMLSMCGVVGYTGTIKVNPGDLMPDPMDMARPLVS